MKLGFIGCGNMARAMIAGILKKGILTPEEILVSAKTQATLDRVKEQYGITAVQDNRQVAQEAQMIVLAVKPVLYEAVIGQIRDLARDADIVVSLAPGKTLSWLEDQFGRKIKLVRCMPNTPAMVGEGMTAVCSNDLVTEEEFAWVSRLFGSFGRTAQVAESLMDAVVAVSGSSPAYVFLFLEALSDGAVAEGMPRSMAYEFAAQAVLGSAKLMLETGMHPGALKDMVCSPGGTTIEAVRVLEEKGMRSAVMEAVMACAQKARE